MFIEKIYVKLLNEGIDMFVPVNAQKIDILTYRVLDDDKKAYEEFLEKWEFKTGDIVRCETKVLSQGTKDISTLVAIEKL